MRKAKSAILEAVHETAKGLHNAGVMDSKTLNMVLTPYPVLGTMGCMEWDVQYHADYLTELEAEPEAVQDEVLSLVGLLKMFGPQLGRPHCDTLNGSRYTNMKELRFTLPDGEWRVAFAFDPERRAILLIGGSKSGSSERKFYRSLNRIADKRFAEHLESLKPRKGE